MNCSILDGFLWFSSTFWSTFEFGSDESFCYDLIRRSPVEFSDFSEFYRILESKWIFSIIYRQSVDSGTTTMVVELRNSSQSMEITWIIQIFKLNIPKMRLNVLWALQSMKLFVITSKFCSFSAANVRYFEILTYLSILIKFHQTSSTTIRVGLQKSIGMRSIRRETSASNQRGELVLANHVHNMSRPSSPRTQMRSNTNFSQARSSDGESGRMLHVMFSCVCRRQPDGGARHETNWNAAFS